MNAVELLSLARQILSGKKGKVETTVATLEAAISELHREREAALAARSSIEGRRRAALLNGETDEAISAIEAKEVIADRQLERLEAAEPLLLKKLAEMRSAARRAEFERLCPELKNAAVEYLTAARAAERAGREMIAKRQSIGANFVEISLLAELPVLPSGAFVIHEPLLAHWELAVEQFFDRLPEIDRPGRAWDGANQPKRDFDYTNVPVRPAAPPAPPKAASKPPTAPAMADDPTFQTIAIGHRAERQIPTEATLVAGADGLVAVDFLRSYTGDSATVPPGRHRVTPGVAMAAMRAGAADIAPGVES